MQAIDAEGTNEQGEENEGKPSRTAKKKSFVGVSIEAIVSAGLLVVEACDDGSLIPSRRYRCNWERDRNRRDRVRTVPPTLGLATVLGERIPRAAPLGYRMMPRCGYAGAADGIRTWRRPRLRRATKGNAVKDFTRLFSGHL